MTLVLIEKGLVLEGWLSKIIREQLGSRHISLERCCLAGCFHPFPCEEGTRPVLRGVRWFERCISCTHDNSIGFTRRISLSHQVVNSTPTHPKKKKDWYKMGCILGLQLKIFDQLSCLSFRSFFMIAWLKTRKQKYWKFGITSTKA